MTTKRLETRLTDEAKRLLRDNSAEVYRDTDSYIVVFKERRLPGMRSDKPRKFVARRLTMLEGIGQEADQANASLELAALSEELGIT